MMNQNLNQGNLQKLREIDQTTDLDFGNATIGDCGAKQIAEALKVNKSLATLDLRNTQIGDSGAKEIAEALKVNKYLTTLNLSENNIGFSERRRSQKV